MKIRVFSALAAIAAFCFSPCAHGQTVRFETNVGNIDVVLLPDQAPLTVQNFLNYVNRGAYTNTFFHRSVRNFIIQGGGYQFDSTTIREIAQDAPVKNEYRLPNTKYTIAMAKLSTDPDSATNQWFFNTNNNTSTLGPTNNNGFTVFGRVTGAASNTVVDRIAALPISTSYASPFGEIPLRATGGLTTDTVVLVSSITVLPTTPAITSGGVVSASSFGGAPAAAPGSYIEIYGTNLAGTTRTWDAPDFTEGRAPTALDDVTVTIGGKSAFVYYVSPSQVNVQVPGDVTNGTNVPVIVSYKGLASSSVSLTVRNIVAGILAPASFKVNGQQYVAAQHSSGAFVSNGTIPGIGAAPATGGEMLTFYGTGFGPVTPGSVAGQIATGQTMTTSAVEFQIGGIPAQVQYAGLSPGLVGLYQFNVTVPRGLPSGDSAVRVLVGGEAIAQPLMISVQ